MSRARAQGLERRAQMLELQAHLQRLTLQATLACWERPGASAWLSLAGGALVKLLAGPKLRWLLIATLLRRLWRARRR